MADRPQSGADDAPHDILAAEGFAVPAPDPELHARSEPAHDVLAADEFAMPAPDPELHHHGPVRLPDEPFGDGRPHDILAAEEFPMPAGRPHPAAALVERRGGPQRAAYEALGLVTGLLLLRRLLRRG